MRRSSEAGRRRLALVVLVVWAALPPVQAAEAKTDTETHCRADEQVYFSCRTGNKLVSLCGGRGDGGEIRSLSYRYGPPGRSENEHTATVSNGKFFLANVSPSSPRASVAQVWFTRGTTSYLITTCSGGDCPYDSGVAVLRGDRVLMQRRCDAGDRSRSAFSPELVTFASDLPESRSKTALLRFEAYDNLVDQLYPTRFDPQR